MSFQPYQKLDAVANRMMMFSSVASAASTASSAVKGVVQAAVGGTGGSSISEAERFPSLLITADDITAQ